MSEYVSKKAVLEWLDDRRYKSPWIESFRERLESGAFDADESESTWKATAEVLGRENAQLDSEIQRLRAALMDTSLLIEDMAVSRIDDFYRLRDNARAMVAMIYSALSATTEPTGAERVREEIKGLLEGWDFRGIAEQLESGYECGVVIELVELCEKLTGAKSPRVNEPEGGGNDA